MARTHAPSQARALVQEARRGHGRPIAALLADARTIADPGHAAETLATLAAEPDCPRDEAARARADACTLAEEVERAWRRAEAMGVILHMTMRTAPEDRARVEARLGDLAEAFDVGEARSNAIAALAPHGSPSLLARLLELARTNGDNPWDDIRVVLRTWLDHAGATDRTALVERIQAEPDAALRARMLAYVDRRLEVTGGHDALDAALDALQEIKDPEEAVEAWRGVLQKATDLEALVRIHAKLAEAPAELRLALLPALVGRAYREKDDPCALSWHDETLATLPRVTAPLPRVRALVNLAKAHARAGETERLAATRAQALRVLETMNEPARGTWTRKLEQAGGSGPAKGKRPATDETPPARTAPSAEATASRAAPPVRRSAPETALRHHALALHDTYTGGLAAAHLRAVARAAPLCDAFELALVLFDFPVSDLEALVKKVEAETNIGEGSGALRKLVAEDRVRLVQTSGGAPPEEWSLIGVPVATTPHPAAHRRTDLVEAAQSGESFGVSNGRVCLVMGLGKQGLPRRWLDSIPLHYEITGREVSLETATAMGILAERLRVLGPVTGGAGAVRSAAPGRGRGRGRGDRGA